MQADTITTAAHQVLRTANARDKATAARELATKWRRGDLPVGAPVDPGLRPARPVKPDLLAPKDMPRRRKAGTEETRKALLHAIAHIELNAIDLSADMLARFGTPDLPRAFFDDWVQVADEEGKHFLLLENRLNDLGASYGDYPAHDGLWEAAETTHADMGARIAIAHMVLEARGLDVTPGMIKRMQKFGDLETASILETIYREEVGHVGIASKWFAHVCDRDGMDRTTLWRDHVTQLFRGKLKRPFNTKARNAAGMEPELYEPLAD